MALLADIATPRAPAINFSAGGKFSPALAEFRNETTAKVLRNYYDAMLAHFGPLKWWSAKTPFEVIVGAILVQNTAWTNVKRVLINLRREKLLTPRAIARVSSAKLARLIRSSGYFRQKAKKLKAFVKFLDKNYSGSLRKMFAVPTQKLREQLLTVHGIGPETADSILLYAAQHPVFVVDTYTKRLLSRHGIVSHSAKYDEIQSLFERHLPRDTNLFNDYHALIVNVGKNWCRKRDPLCSQCPLGEFLPASPVTQSHQLLQISPAQDSAQ